MRHTVGSWLSEALARHGRRRQGPARAERERSGDASRAGGVKSGRAGVVRGAAMSHSALDRSKPATVRTCERCGVVEGEATRRRGSPPFTLRTSSQSTVLAVSERFYCFRSHALAMRRLHGRGVALRISLSSFVASRPDFTMQMRLIRLDERSLHLLSPYVS